MIGSVYFVECAGLIKIGHTANIQKRLSSLRTGAPAPMVLLGQVAGARDLEQYLHFTVREHHSHREWFFDRPAVREVIATVMRDGPGAVGFEPRPIPPEAKSIPPGWNWATVERKLEEISLRLDQIYVARRLELVAGLPSGQLLSAMVGFKPLQGDIALTQNDLVSAYKTFIECAKRGHRTDLAMAAQAAIGASSRFFAKYRFTEGFK